MLGNIGTFLTVGAALIIGFMFVKKFEVEVNTDFKFDKEHQYDVDFEFEFEREKDKKHKGRKGKKNKDKDRAREMVNVEREYQDARDTTIDTIGPYDSEPYGYDELIMPTL